MSFFKDITSGNPFATPVGHMIEQATDGSQASENWALLIEVCDLINEKDDGPKDAMRAIRKRLSNNVGKNYTVVMYTLALLETCVKNCGKRFHILVANKDFLQDLVKIMGPKNDPPQVVQEKILSLIQTWADAFQGAPDLKEVGKMYMELKSKGIEFPMTDLDHMAPIHTPARTHGAPEPTPPATRPVQRAPTQRGAPITHPAVAQQQPLPRTGPVLLGAEQMAKLKSELDVVQQNYRVFSDMLTEITPGQENPADLELIRELNGSCRQMQSRLVELLESVQNEDVTCELLRINDELNNVFLRYDRFHRLRTSVTGSDQTAPVTQQRSPTGLAAPPPSYGNVGAQLPAVQPASRTTPSASEAPTANLIDFGDTPPPSTAHAQSPFIMPVVPPITGGKDVTPSALGSGGRRDVDARLANMDQCDNNSTSGLASQLGALSITSGHVAGQEGAGDEDFDMFAQSRQSFEQNKGQANSSSTTSGHVAGQEGAGDEDFDMFAQSRQSFEQSKGQTNSSSAYSAQKTDQFSSGGLGKAFNARTSNPYNEDKPKKKPQAEGTADEDDDDELIDRESDFAEMEKYLRENPGQTATSSEFDQFLSERATDSESSRNGRQMQTRDQDDALFSL